MNRTKINDLSFLNGKFDNLKKLILNDNSITELRYIDNCTNLVELNLSNNLFNDNSSYRNMETGETVTYKNLDLIAKLNPANGGALQKLFLSGNENNIVNWTPISSLYWVEKSGF